MLRFKLAYLQLFPDWIIYVFHYFTFNEWDFQLLQINIMKILFRANSHGSTRFMLLFKLAYLQLFSDWLIYMFHYFTCKEWDFQLLKKYVIKILFWDDSNSGNRFMLWFKSPPYAPFFYVKTIKMCIHPQGVSISTFSNISYKILFWGYSSGANQIYAMIQIKHCKQS